MNLRNLLEELYIFWFLLNIMINLIFYLNKLDLEFFFKINSSFFFSLFLLFFILYFIILLTKLAKIMVFFG